MRFNSSVSFRVVLGVLAIAVGLAAAFNVAGFAERVARHHRDGGATGGGYAATSVRGVRLSGVPFIVIGVLIIAVQP